MPYPVLHREVFYCGTDLGGTPIYPSPQLSALLDLSSEGVCTASAGFLFPVLGTLPSFPTSSPFPLFSGSLSLPWAKQFQGLGQDRSPEVVCTFQRDSKSCDQSSPHRAPSNCGQQVRGHLGKSTGGPRRSLIYSRNFNSAKPASTCREWPLSSPSFSPATVHCNLQMAGCGPQQGLGFKPGVPVLPPRGTPGWATQSRHQETQPNSLQN